MAENTQPAPNNNATPAVDEQQQVIRQYAEVAGLDAERPEHVVIIVQTLQAAAEKGMTADNQTQMTAIVAVMQEMARLQERPEEMKALAGNLGLDITTVEQQQQESISQLQQTDQQLRQNENRAADLRAKASSRSIINYIASAIGAIGGFWLSRFAMRKFMKDKLEPKMKNGAAVLKKDGTPEQTFGKEGRGWRRFGGTASGILGFGILAKISAAIFTAPLEKEYKQLEEQSAQLLAQKQAAEDRLQDQGLHFIDDLSKRLLTVAVQQIEQQQKQAKVEQPQVPPSQPPVVAGQPAADESTPVHPSPQAEHYVRRMDGVNKEIEDARREVELHPGQLPHAAPTQPHTAVESAPGVVKKQTGAEVVQNAVPQPEGDGKYTAAVGKPAENHTAAVTAAPATDTMQPAF